MELARWLIHLASYLVPSDCRADWRREWLAELAARPGRQGGPRPFVFACGAPVHALWLRVDGWRPSLLWSDARFALRGLARRPGFALAATLTLALGIGATMAIFSVVYGILLKPLPYREPEQLVQLWETNPLRNWTDATVAPGNLISWRERTHAFQDIAWYPGSSTRDGDLRSLTLGGDDPARVRGLPVSVNFFDVLGVTAREGRTFVKGEDEAGHHQEIVLSASFWRSRFGGDRAVVGRDVRLNGVRFTVIGVMPESFRFGQPDTDFWMPLVMDISKVREMRVPHLLRVLARIKPGVTLAQAREDLSDVAHALEREYPVSNKAMGAGLGPLDDWFVGQTRRPLWLFLAAVGFVLLIACANVTNLLLSRTTERVREMSLRAALGASRSRLVRQLLVESLVIVIAGTALGGALALLGVRMFVRLAPVGLARLGEVGLNPMVGGFAIVLMSVTTLFVGLVPAWQGAQPSLRGALADGARGTSASGQRARRLLVLTEVALAVVLLVGAALTLRSFRALAALDVGVPVDGVVTAKLSLPAARYGGDGKSAAFFEDALSRVRATTGVVAAGATARLPLEGPSWTGDLYIEGRPEFHGLELRHASVTTGYLTAIGVKVLAGRTIDLSDRDGAPLVVVANDALARKFFPNGDALGHRIAFDAPGPKVRWRTIVGVVSDERQDGSGAPAEPEVFDSNFQEEFSDLTFVVRSASPPDRVLADIRRAVHDLDPQLALYETGPLSDLVARSLAKPRVAAWMIGVFGIVALLLATIGVYGVAAYSVAARTREIGVRVAFGATRSDILSLVVRQELAGVVAGLVVGCAMAAVISRALSSMLFGVTGGDPVSYATALGVLLAAGVTACLVPARRALRVHPMTALRMD